MIVLHPAQAGVAARYGFRRRMPRALAALAAAGAVLGAASAARAVETPDEVEVYTDCNFSGVVARLRPGDYDLAQLQAAGLANDTLSAVRVPPGYKVTLFEHFRFGGRTATLTNDTGCLLSQQFNDLASSLKITRTADMQVNSVAGPVGGADVAALPDGRFVVAWSNSRTGKVSARTFDAQGAPLTSEFEIGGGGGVVRAAPIGLDIAFVWDGCPGRGVCVRLFNAAGRSLTQAEAVQTTAGFSARPGIAVLPDRRFVVAWEWREPMFITNDPRDWDIYARIYDERGYSLGPDTLVTEEAGSYLDNTQILQRDLALAPLSTEYGYVIFWGEEKRRPWRPAYGFPISRAVKHRAYNLSIGPNAPGGPVGTLAEISLDDGMALYAGRTAAGRGGATWFAGLLGTPDVVLASMDAQGIAGPSIPLASPGPGATIVDPDIAQHIDTAGLVVFTETRVVDVGDTAIRGRLFKPGGAAERSVFLINTTLSGRQSAPAVAPLPAGYVVVWIDSQPGQPSSVRARIVNP